MSPHSRMSDSTESFTSRVYNLHIEIIKQIQASNEQYKFQADLHMYHDAFNIEDYFMIRLNLNGVF